MDDLVNVVNGVVVDASVYAFNAQTVTLVFACLGIFSANLFYLQSLTKVAHFSLLQCALPSVLCELTLPTMPTPPLPEPSLWLCWLPGRVGSHHLGMSFFEVGWDEIFVQQQPLYRLTQRTLCASK